MLIIIINIQFIRIICLPHTRRDVGRGILQRLPDDAPSFKGPSIENTLA
jgi:hypothetical protein